MKNKKKLLKPLGPIIAATAIGVFGFGYAAHAQLGGLLKGQESP